MAKRKRDEQRDTRVASGAPGFAPGEGQTTSVVVARVGDDALGFRMEGVGEIIRVPRLAYMPFAPPALLGLANLRGTVVPIVSVRRLLGLPDASLDSGARALIIVGDTPVGLVVDRVEMLAELRIARAASDGHGGRHRAFEGSVTRAEGETAFKLVNAQLLLKGQFDRIGVPKSYVTTSATKTVTTEQAASKQRMISFVTFDLGAQEYALPLERVREITPLPASIPEVARSEAAVLGVVTMRDRLLPLVSLRALLGMPPRPADSTPGKVIIVSIGSGSVGVVADRTREVLHVDERWIDPAPALLVRGDGDAEIEAIGRLEGGERLVAILAPDRLFRSDVVQRVLASASHRALTNETTEIAMPEEQFIVFRLGTQEYGIPITAVSEIARAPQITPVPKAPPFVEGVMNLRGAVLPIVNLSKRFGLPPSEQSLARRVLVLTLGAARSGFSVDAVTEVLKVPDHSIQSSPELSHEQMRLLGRVANLDGRLILLVDPGQLLTEAEVYEVAALAAATPSADLIAS